MGGNTINIKRSDMDRLLTFLPLFDVCGRTFVVPGPDGEPDYANLHVVPEETYEDYLATFFQEIRRPCWHVELDNVEAAAHLVYCDCEIALSSLDDIRTMLCWCGSDCRDVPVFRRMLMQDGRLTSILRQLKRLRDQLYPD